MGLMQEHRRSRRDARLRMLQIGFIVYEVPFDHLHYSSKKIMFRWKNSQTKDPGKRLPVEHLMYNYETVKSGTYVNFREVCIRFKFRPGRV